MLFCEPHNAPFYMGRGWKPFDGEIYAEQPEGRVRFDAIAPYVYHIKRAPLQGTIDLCGLAW
jgi:aminoglycoside 2'-N-acetyltransferase I